MVVGLGCSIPGWCLRAFLRYADLIASAVAFSSTSRISYGFIAPGGSSISESRAIMEDSRQSGKMREERWKCNATDMVLVH